MNGKYVFFVWVCSICFFNSGHGNTLNLPVMVPADEGVDVKECLVVGAFNLGGDGDYNGVDFLKSIGSSETVRTGQAFLQDLLKMPEDRARKMVYQGHSEFLDFDYLYKYTFEYDNERKLRRVAYAAFIIRCETPRTAWMLLGSAGALRVIINGEDVLHIDTDRKMSIYGEALQVDLNKGDNFVLVKVPKKDTVWGLRIHLSLGESEALATALMDQLSYQKYLLRKNLFFSSKEPIQIVPRGAPLVDMEGRIQSLGGLEVGAIEKQSVKWLQGGVQDGLYEVILNLSGGAFHERFLIGNPLAMLDNVVKEIDKVLSHKKYYAHLNIIKKRLQISREDYIKRFGDSDIPKKLTGRGWQRRFIQELWDGEQALLDIEAGKEPFKHRPGLHLRGFVSGIDGNLESYRIYVPSTYSETGKQLPLLVLFPTATSAAQPFIDSPYIRDYDFADRMSALAEKNGVILLWPGYRKQPDGNLCETAHLGEVLESLKGDYNYDERRVVLMGACSGAAMAMDAVADWPGRFAGLAFLNPEFVLDQTMPEKVMSQFLRRKEFRNWYMQKRGVSSFLHSKSPDVFIINDGGDLGHGDLHASRSFERRAKQADAPVDLQLRPKTEAQHLGAWDELMQWAVEQRRGDRGGILHRMRHNNMQDALTEQFVVVQGTAGFSDENRQINEIVDKIKEEWSKVCFGPCRVAKDHELRDEDLSNMNLVLVGNASANGIWKKLEKRLGVEIAEDCIRWGTHTWNGRGLAIQLVVPAPDNNSRKIVLIGGHNLSVSRFGTLNLLRDGWFKCAVWGEGDLESPDLIEVISE